MSTVTDWAARVSSYAYTPSGLVARLAYPNGLVATYGYDRAQRLVDLQYTGSGGTLTFASQHFTLDPEGDRTALDESALLQTNPPTLATDHYAMSYDGARAPSPGTAPTGWCSAAATPSPTTRSGG